MVPPTSPAFIRLSDGKVLGKPTPATADDSLRINPLPTRKPKNLRPTPIVHRGAGQGPRRRPSKTSAPADGAAAGRTRRRAGTKKATTAPAAGEPALTQGSRPRPAAADVRGRDAAARVDRAAAARSGSLRGASLVRLRIGFLLIAMVVSVFAARLFQLQGVDAQAYVAKARAEGVVTVTLPANRGTITDRNGVPLAESVDGLMIVADPSLTVKHAERDRHDPGPPARRRLLRRARPAAQAGHPLPVHRPAGPGHQGPGGRRRDRRQAASRASTPGATRCATYPADDVAANLVGFMNDEGDAAEGAELMFDTHAGRQGRLGDVRDGRRQPHPARRQQHRAGRAAATTCS